MANNRPLPTSLSLPEMHRVVNRLVDMIENGGKAPDIQPGTIKLSSASSGGGASVAPPTTHNNLLGRDANDTHTASTITNVAYGLIAATNIQAAINELEDEKQPRDATLTALAGLDFTPGFVVETGDDTFTKRSLEVASGELTLTNPAGTASNPSFGLYTVNVSPGTFGSASKTPTITVDAKGRATTVTHQDIAITGLQVSNTPAGTIESVTVQAAINELDGDGTLIRNAFVDGKMNTGFVSRADNTITLSTRTVTVAPTATNFAYYLHHVKFTKTGGATCQTTIADTAGIHYIYFDAAGQLQNSMTPWNIVDGTIFVAIVFWNGSAGALYDERHSAGRDVHMHKWAHDTIGTRYQSGLSRTYPDPSNSKLQIESGSIHDEDIDFVIAQQKLCRNFYQTDAAVWTFADGTDNGGFDRPYIWNATTSRIQYPKSDSSYALTDAAANRYIVVWAFATLDTVRPIMIITEAKTAPYTSVAAARAAVPPSTVGLLTPEMKIIYRWIFAGDGTFQEEVDYRSSSSLPAGGTPTVQHNDTLGKQGGGSGEYYHLTSSDYNNVVALNAFVINRITWGF
jgi:hypothetical protein